MCDEYCLGAAARREVLDLVGASFDLAAGFVRRRVEAGDAAFVERPDRLGGPQRFERRRLWWQCRRDDFAHALALVYLLAIRPQVAAQQSTGPDPGPPPPPPPPAVPLA